MSKLKIKEKIEKEENSKIKNIIGGIIVILFAWLLINIVLKITMTGRIIITIALILCLAYLIYEWYKVYYK